MKLLCFYFTSFFKTDFTIRLKFKIEQKVETIFAVDWIRQESNKFKLDLKGTFIKSAKEEWHVSYETYISDTRPHRFARREDR